MDTALDINPPSLTGRRMWSISLSASIGVHIAVALLIWWLVDPSEAAPLNEKEAERTVKITLTPMAEEAAEVASAVAELPEPVVEEAEEPTSETEKFVDTTEDQAAEPERETSAIAERDTAARSDAAPSGDEQDIAQKGEKDLPTEDTFAQRTQLGSEQNPEPVEGEGAPQTGAEVGEIESIESPEAVERVESITELTPKEPDTPAEAQEASEPAFQEAERSETLPEPKRAETEDAKPKVEERKPAEQPVAPPRKQVRPKSEDPAFSGLRRKNYREGTIGRQSDITSVDAKGTPVGKYHSQVLGLIEHEWRVNVHRYRDLILPGQIAISFLVRADGTPYKIRFEHQLEGGAVQNGFSMGAIQRAKLPKMPSDVVEELNGDPLEILIRFNF